MPSNAHTGGGGTKYAATAGEASSSNRPFTAEMRDRQARGKNPYNSDSEDSDLTPAQGIRSVRYGNHDGSIDEDNASTRPAGPRREGA
jgi:hypothetical protein